MKYRCPYCKHIIQSKEPPSLCPHCQKSMTIPDNLRKRALRQRKKDREKIQAVADRERARIFTPNFQFGKKSSTMFVVMGLLVLAGAGLIYQAGKTKKPNSEYHRIQRAEKELTALRMALECFKRDCGRYPTTEEGLDSLINETGVQGWAGRYVNKIKPDQWRTPYQYSLVNDEITLCSYGPDQTAGTSDDLFAEQPEETDNGDSETDEDFQDNTEETSQIHEININPNM